MRGIGYYMGFIENRTTGALMLMGFYLGMLFVAVPLDAEARLCYNVIMDMPCGKYCHWEHHAKDKHQGKYE